MRVIRGRTPVKWKRVGSSKILASSCGIEIGVQSFQHPRTGVVVENSFFAKPEGITVCALTSGGNILLVEQFKQAVYDIVSELPSGLIRPGEDAVVAGERELREETGFASGKVVLTSSPEKLLHAPRRSQSGFFTCVASNCRDEGNQRLDATEDAIKVLEATPEEVWEFLRSGKIRSVESREAIFNASLMGYLRFS